MNRSRPPAQLKEFLEPYDPAIRQLALRTRALVLDVFAPCCETIYDAYSAVALGYGPTERMKDLVVHVAVYSGHVNIGFNDGASMPDPERLLEGSGKRIRHIAIRSEAELDRPAVRAYVEKARREAADAFDAHNARGVRTIIKPPSPRKRRPRSRD